MPGPDRQATPRCHNCGIDIAWSPVVHQGHPFCCGGCAQGGPCYCSYDLATLNGGSQWWPGRAALATDARDLVAVETSHPLERR